MVFSPNDSIIDTDFQAGRLFLIDKPLDWTSFDVVKKLRYTLKSYLGKKMKVGHAGTLDPLATGLLIVAVGKFTKKIDTLQGMEKEYEATLKLGATTPCFDSEMEEEATYPTEHITEELINQQKELFVGVINQTVPIFSAVKINGERLYRLARKGEKPESKTRKVIVHSFDINAVNMPFVDFVVRCEKGTYIRSLANDLGKELGSGAYLTALRRTRIGEYHVKDAWQLNDLIETIRNAKRPEKKEE